MAIEHLRQSTDVFAGFWWKWRSSAIRFGDNTRANVSRVAKLTCFSSTSSPRADRARADAVHGFADVNLPLASDAAIHVGDAILNLDGKSADALGEYRGKLQGLVGRKLEVDLQSAGASRHVTLVLRELV